MQQFLIEFSVHELLWFWERIVLSKFCVNQVRINLNLYFQSNTNFTVSAIEGMETFSNGILVKIAWRKFEIIWKIKHFNQVFCQKSCTWLYVLQHWKMTLCLKIMVAIFGIFQPTQKVKNWSPLCNSKSSEFNCRVWSQFLNNNSKGIHVETLSLKTILHPQDILQVTRVTKDSMKFLNCSVRSDKGLHVQVLVS